jgi:hypothetical protein
MSVSLSDQEVASVFLSVDSEELIMVWMSQLSSLEPTMLMTLQKWSSYKK